MSDTLTYGESLAQQVTVDHSYDNFGLPAGWMRGNDMGVAVSRQLRDPNRIERMDWYMPGLAGNVFRALSYDYNPNGLLEQEHHEGFFVDEDEVVFDVDYDEQLRVRQLSGNDRIWERYSYDAIGNMVSMRRLDEEFWAYSPATAFNEITERTDQTRGVVHGHEYDAVAGFMTRWSVQGTDNDSSTGYGYDGSGRLAYASRARLLQIGNKVRPIPDRETRFHYDFDDQMVLEQDVFTGRDVRRFQGWWLELDHGDPVRQIESVLPMVRLENGDTLRWQVVEPDGHALASYDEQGGELQVEVVGAYGVPLEEPAMPYPLDGFHGQEVQRDLKLVQMGVRTTLWRDGMWMQPEPLLAMGLKTAELSRPHKHAPSYGSGNPFEFTDLSGWKTDVDELNLREQYQKGDKVGVPNAVAESSEEIANLHSDVQNKEGFQSLYEGADGSVQSQGPVTEVIKLFEAKTADGGLISSQQDLAEQQAGVTDLYGNLQPGMRPSAGQHHSHGVHPDLTDKDRKGAADIARQAGAGISVASSDRTFRRGQRVDVALAQRGPSGAITVTTLKGDTTSGVMRVTSVQVRE